MSCMEAVYIVNYVGQTDERHVFFVSISTELVIL